jgi:hypothetical protein
MNTVRLTALLLLFLSSLKCYSQTDSVQRVPFRKIAPVIITESALYGASIAYLWGVYYKDVPRVPFEFYNDNKGYLQIDKCGHAFGSYLEGYISYHWLRSVGVKKKNALIFGAPIGLILQAQIEVLDGMYEGWGFSNGDMVANAAGSAIIIGQELAFDGQPIKYKLSFTRSSYADQANGYLGNNNMESFFYDYNGHTYWLSGGIHHAFPKRNIPEWINLSVGYSANGMFGEFKNITYYRGVTIPPTERYRQFLLAPDIDWTKIPTRSKFLHAIFQGMFFIKLPAPAIEVNTLGKVKGYWLYF